MVLGKGSSFNPFTAAAWKKIRAEKYTHAPANSICSGQITNFLSTLSILIEILSNANARRKKKKTKTESSKDFKFHTFIGHF